MYRIVFNTETFQSTLADGVELDLQHPSLIDRVRLRGIFIAIGALSAGWQWTEQTGATAVAALKDSGQLFENCVRKVRGLSAPASVCRTVGVVVKDDAKDDDAIPIETGQQFARVAPYVPELAIEVAFRLIRLANRREANGVTVG